MRILNLFILIAAGAFISGCSSWSKEKCQSTNWDAMGYSEGSQGKANASSNYAQRCEKQGVRISTDSYLKGYNRGLTVFCSSDSGYRHAMAGTAILSTCSANLNYKEGYAKGRKDFCTEDNGFTRGSNGNAYGNLCTVAEEKSYGAGYKKGRQIFLAKEIKEIKVDLEYANTDLNRVRDDIADRQYQLTRVPERSREPSVMNLRLSLESEIESLFSQRDSIRKKIDDMQRLLHQYERELN